MSIEAGIVLGWHGEVLYRHQPLRASAGGLPDSRELWDVLWSNRRAVAGFAHSHPGTGVPVASGIDVTTFRAVELALGFHMDWWIVSEDCVVLYQLCYNPNGTEYRKVPVEWTYGSVRTDIPVENSAWVKELRLMSNYKLKGEQHG